MSTSAADMTYHNQSDTSSKPSAYFFMLGILTNNSQIVPNQENTWRVTNDSARNWKLILQVYWTIVLHYMLFKVIDPS